MDKGKSAMPLLAIVAIVAVVAVVMVVLQGRTPSSEEAVAGEASQLAQIKPTSVLTPKLVNQDTLVSHYGSIATFRYGKSADVICKDLGYKSCFAGVLNRGLTYYESKDGSCTNIQSIDNRVELSPCSQRGVQYIGSCHAINDTYLREPYLGDIIDGSGLTTVICFE